MPIKTALEKYRKVGVRRFQHFVRQNGVQRSGLGEELAFETLLPEPKLNL